VWDPSAPSREEEQDARSREVLAPLVAWREKQKQQECPAVPQDEDAKSLVREAQLQQRKISVHGETMEHREKPVLQHLWSRPNPNGAGVIVTASQDGRSGSADRTRKRAIWLVLENTIYPLNGTASAPLGVLKDLLPPQIAERAGLPRTFKTETTLGIEDDIFFRWHWSENPLPQCP
jgi:hypothetical protein